MAEPVEQLITEAIFSVVDSGLLAAALAERSDHTKRALETTEAIEAKLTKLAEQWAQDLVTDAEWQTARDALGERLRTAQEELASQTTTRALDRFLGDSEPLREAWSDIPLDRQRAIVRTLFDSITIMPNPVPGRNTFDASLVVPRWRF